MMRATESWPGRGGTAPSPRARLTWPSAVVKTSAFHPVAGSRLNDKRPAAGGLFADAGAGGGALVRGAEVGRRAHPAVRRGWSDAVRDGAAGEGVQPATHGRQQQVR